MDKTTVFSHSILISAPRLVPHAVIIAVTSLSIHVVMLQVLHIPYPDMSGVGRLGLVLVALRVLALLVVYRLSLPVLGSLSVAGRIAAVALLDMAVAGNVRGAIMEAVVTADAAFPAIKLLAQLAQSLVLAMLVVATARLTRRPVGLLATALALTGIMTFLVGPLAGAALAPFIDLLRPEIYAVPYGAYVLAWSYATFLETVTAVLAIGILVGRGLSANRTLAFLQFITLILLLRGTLVMQLLFPWSMRGDHLAAVTSTLQFFLQDLVLAGLAWCACRQERNTAS